MEKISIRRTSQGTMVNLTIKSGDHSVHHQVRVLGATSALIAAAIRECRAQCKMLLAGIEEAAA